ncbi:MAG: helix-turn-helix domain-containing protein [Bacillaceae bacterium]
MIQELGKHIRDLRNRKGIGLNEFAKELDVSAGYLSNLETGKSKTITFDVLEKIQNELNILPLESRSPYTHRMKRIEYQLSELEKKNPIYSEFILHNMESSIEWFKQQESHKSKK